MGDNSSPLVRKLQHFVPLSEKDIRVLEELGATPEDFSPHTDIISEGEVPRSVFILLEGFACRYRILENGQRQIITFLLPGDVCDLHVFLLKAMDHSIRTLSQTKLAAVKTDDILRLVFHHPRISAAMWWSTLQEESILRERIVALGRRVGEGRVAYILCELLWRFRAIGITHDKSYSLPLSQNDLADTLGLTPVYVNRILQKFRRKGYISLERRALTIDAEHELMKIAGFNADYLHLGGAPEEVEKQFARFERTEARNNPRRVSAFRF